MSAGIFLLLLIVAGLTASFVRRSMNEQESGSNRGFEKYVIKKGKRLSKRPSLTTQIESIDIAVMFCKNCQRTINSTKQIHTLYGYSLGFGRWNCVSICWKVKEDESKIGLYLEIVQSGICNYYPLRYVNAYEEIEIRVHRALFIRGEGVTVTITQPFKQTFQYRTLASLPKLSSFGLKLYPKIATEREFDIEILIKELS